MKKFVIFAFVVTLVMGCEKTEVTEITEVRELKAIRMDLNLCFEFENGRDFQLFNDSDHAPEKYNLLVYAFNPISGSMVQLPGDLVMNGNQYDLRFEYKENDGGVIRVTNPLDNIGQCFDFEFIYIPVE